MVEKILKETYVNPKVELTQSDYNRLVELARMKAKKIEERARALYEKEGVCKIHFNCRITSRKGVDVETEEFKCDCPTYLIRPCKEDKTLFMIPSKAREKIAKNVEYYVKRCFEGTFGRNLSEINEIHKLKRRQERLNNKFIAMTILGWLTAILMFLAAILF